jgi:hypothetical protein
MRRPKRPAPWRPCAAGFRPVLSPGRERPPLLVDAHDAALRGHGVRRAAIWTARRVAATVRAAAALPDDGAAPAA